MPFSFNPGQTAQDPNAPTMSAPGAGIAPTAGGMPSVPDSPFLFMQQRDQPTTVNAYIQMILVVVSVLAVLVTVISFGYSMYLTSSIESKKQQLDLKEGSFKEYPFAEMKRLSDRASLLSGLLKNYISVRSPLRFLEDVVERQVYFTEFYLSKNATGGYNMSFTAATDNYKALIQQLEALNLTQYSKVVPKPNLEKFTDESNLLKVKVITPVFTQGVLPDDIVFVQPGESATSTPQITSPTSASSTPVISTTTQQ